MKTNVFLVSLKCIFWIKMSGFEKLFSLEDDEWSELFITQEPRNNIAEILEKTDENLQMECGKFLGTYGNDFALPCTWVVQKGNMPIYSDISDDEDFQKLHI